VHEYSIVQSLYDAVMEHASAHGAAGVHRVRVRIGEMSGVDVGLLETAWRTFRVRTPCENAEMDVALVRPRWECPSCGIALKKGSVLRCATCSGPLRLVEGDEILLDQIVMEVP
jgi:hydrogenase nickel incorporation protein HypA/HybF